MLFTTLLTGPELLNVAVLAASSPVTLPPHHETGTEAVWSLS